jgi:hypothetical protein
MGVKKGADGSMDAWWLRDGCGWIHGYAKVADESMVLHGHPVSIAIT